MSTMTITHSDWELLEAVTPGSTTFDPQSTTVFSFSVPLGGKTATFTVHGTFSNPAGMSVSAWLASASGTVNSIALDIGGVEQFNATGLSIDLSEILDDAADKVHDVVETALGGKDNISGSLEDDHISGHGGDDTISGGHGNDDLFGEVGDDKLSGGDGRDDLFGGSGIDSVSGGLGDDRLYGGSGSDRITGGHGADDLSGGAGHDIFDFNSLSELGLGSILRDDILSFVRGEDKIDLSTIDANSHMANNQAFEFVTAFHADATGEVRYANGIVHISTDVDAQAEYQIALVGVAPATLNAGDFSL